LIPLEIQWQQPIERLIAGLVFADGLLVQLESAAQPLEAPKYSNFTVAFGRTATRHTNFKKSVLPKSGRSGALLGLNFRVFFY
jgi:hypothetical protein